MCDGAGAGGGEGLNGLVVVCVVDGDADGVGSDGSDAVGVVDGLLSAAVHVAGGWEVFGIAVSPIDDIVDAFAFGVGGFEGEGVGAVDGAGGAAVVTVDAGEGVDDGGLVVDTGLVGE